MTTMILGLVVMLALVATTVGIAYWAGQKYHDFSLPIWGVAALVCFLILGGWAYWIYQGIGPGLPLGGG